MTLDEYIKSENKKAAVRNKPRITDATFGALIDLSQAHVCRLRNGKSRPSWEVMEKIANVTGKKVSPNDWYTEAAQ